MTRFVSWRSWTTRRRSRHRMRCRCAMASPPSCAWAFLRRLKNTRKCHVESCPHWHTLCWVLMYYSLPASNVIYLIIHCAHPEAIAAPVPEKLMKAANKKNPPWPAPKRGKARSLMKAFPMKRKMPKVAYVRDQKTVMKVDKRKIRWGRPVHMLASLQGRSLLRLLRSDG